MYSERVSEIIDYVTDHPIEIQAKDKMMYRGLSDLDSGRLPSVLENLSREDVVMEYKEKGSRVNSAPLTLEEAHMSDVVLALLYLSCGGLDEAHDIVLPYSWPEYTCMGGKPVLDSPASQESEYCHALVHRQEGEHVGELGMLGWSNACFWFSKTGRHQLFPSIKKNAIAIVKEHYPDNMNYVEMLGGQNKDWDPDVFTELCQKATAGDKKLVNFCEKVINMEWKTLLDHCNEKIN